MNNSLSTLSTTNTFGSIFDSNLALQDISDVEGKVKALSDLVKELEDVESKIENDKEVFFWLGMAQGVFTLGCIISAASIPPLLALATTSFSVVSSAVGIASTTIKQAQESPIAEKLKRYRLCLRSKDLMAWAYLWHFVGKEIFVDALYEGTTGQIEGNKIRRPKNLSSFEAVLRHSAGCLGVTPEALATEINRFKAGKSTTISPHKEKDLLEKEIERLPNTTIQNAPLPVTDTIDIPEELARALKLSLIVGTPGAGKGVFVSNALSAVKRIHPNTTVFYIDPKNESKEDGYFEGGRVDRAFRTDMLSDDDPETSYQWLKNAIAEYENFNSHGVKLLVVDELKLILNTLSQVSGKAVKWFSSRLSAYGSSGDARGIVVWAINQSAHALPGFDGSDRSMFIPVFLIDGRNISAAQGLLAAKMISNSSKPSGEQLREYCLRSPVARAIYYGGTDKWYPMPKLQNFSGYDRDSRIFLPGYTPPTNQVKSIGQQSIARVSPAEILDKPSSNDFELLSKEFEATKLGISKEAYLLLEKLRKSDRPMDASQLAQSKPFGNKESHKREKIEYFLVELVNKELAEYYLEGDKKIYSPINK